jgi:hypothetical protein
VPAKNLIDTVKESPPVNLTRLVCSCCLISIELCPVHKKHPHVEGEPVPAPTHVFMPMVQPAAITSAWPVTTSTGNIRQF